MNRKLLRILMALLVGIMAPAAFAETSTVTMTTQAPAGTELRIYTLPYNSATITGVDKGKYFGTYLSKGPGTQITITGDLDELEVFRCQLSELSVASAPTMYILRCYENQLTTLDLSACKALATLDCHNNSLTSLDVSDCPLLEELNAGENKLTSVTLGSLPKLSKLTLASNKLVGVDLSGLTLLEDLYIQDNLLTALDLSASKKINWIYAFCNQIAGTAMDDFMTNLPKAAQSPSMLYIVDTLAGTPDGNVCLVKNVQTAQSKGWVTMDYAGGADNGSLIGQFYYGADYVPTISEKGVKFTTSRTAGQTVKLYIKAAGDFSVEGVAETSFVSGSNTLTLTSQEVTVKGDLTSFECPDNDITALSFEGTPTSLTYFDCKNNKLESLEVTGATALTQIYAENNALKSLNIEGCTGIMRVNCYSNQLKGSAMKLFMQSLPDGTANNPYLFVIDTQNSAEGNVATTTDVAIATGKGWSVFDYSGGANFGFGTQYEGSEPTEPTVPEEYFTLTVQVAEVMLNLEFSDPEYYPVVEDAEILGWNGSILTLRVTPGKTAKVYGDVISFAANLASIDSFDASACPNLVDLNLMLNELKTLDVSKNTKLQTLSVLGNSLESLEVASCPDLYFINCYGNCLRGEAMTRLMSTLPMRTASEAGQIIIYDGNYGREHNECLVADVNAALERYWITYELDADMEPIRYKGKDNTGIENVTGAEAPAEYYNLQGVKVANPSGGIFIRRQGSTTTKVIIK